MDRQLKTLLASATLAASLTSPTSHAFDTSILWPDYAGLFLVSETTYEQISYNDSEFSSIIGRFGYTLNRFIELEFRIGSGTETVMAPQDIGGTIQDTDFNVDSIVGGYLVGSLPVEEVGRVYTLLGYNIVGITTNIPPGDGTESDISFGFGGDVFIGKKFSVNVEYTSYLFQRDLELNALSFGAKINF